MKRPLFKSELASIIDLYLDKCEMSFSPLTLPGYYRALKSFDTYLLEHNYNGGDISFDLMNSWIESLRPRKNNTIRNYQRIVSLLLRFATAYGINSQIPELIIDKNQYIPHIFTEEERARIFKFLDSYSPKPNSKNPYIKVVLPMAVRIMDSCGTRETETLSIQMKDVNLKDGILTLRNTKGNKERFVPMHSSLTKILSRYCLSMGILSTPEAYVFPGKNMNEPLKSDTFSHLFAHILLCSGVEGNREQKHSRSICAHCLRHSFACRSLEHMNALELDEDDRFPYLSTYLGHENLYSTERYLNYPTDRMDDDVTKLESFGIEIFNSIPIFQDDISEWTK